MKNPKVRSYICRKEGYVVSIASVIDTMSEYLDHYVASDVETVEQKDFDDVKKILGFICGMAPFMPSDGIYGWTFSLPDAGRKIFASLNLKDRTYVCRTHKWKPDKHEKTPRVALQMVSEIQQLNRVGLFDIEVNEKKSGTIEKLMERYFEVEAKVKVYTQFRNDELIIFKPFSSCSKEGFVDVLKRLKEDSKKVEERLETLEDFRFDFFCGCCGEKISEIFSALKKEDIDFLFKNDEKVKAECPRCGKKYQFKREDICVK